MAPLTPGFQTTQLGGHLATNQNSVAFSRGDVGNPLADHTLKILGDRQGFSVLSLLGTFPGFAKSEVSPADNLPYPPTAGRKQPPGRRPKNAPLGTIVPGSPRVPIPDARCPWGAVFGFAMPATGAFLRQNWAWCFPSVAGNIADSELRPQGDSRPVEFPESLEPKSCPNY